EVYTEVGEAETIIQTYEGIKRALTLLGDNHSVLVNPDRSRLKGNSKINFNVKSVPPVSVPDDVGYVKITSFSGGGDAATAFADKIQKQIRSADSPSLVGWIVDLRGNTGCNMWPMLAGISPILGEDTIGYFVDAKERRYHWEVRNGSSYNSNRLKTAVTEPYVLANPEPKVAVLLDKGVMSSGEAVAIAFVGRENTRSFGSATCGLSTANKTYRLDNNSVLALTVAYMADRNLKVYGTPIEPDEEVASEAVVQRAIAWLQTVSN
ncbi:MAG: S41 family peptidase, partial [Cyclobacteriaceae bacterium]